MKAIIILIISVFSVTSAYSQRVSLSNLLRIHNSTVVEAEDILLGLGFKFGRDYGKVGELESHSFQKNDSKSDDYLNVAKDVFKGRNVRTSLFSLHENDYVLLKKAINAAGYKFVETTKPEKYGISVDHTYIKGGLEISLSVSLTDNSHPAGANVTMYYIAIWDIDNRRFYFNDTRH